MIRLGANAKYLVDLADLTEVQEFNSSPEAIKSSFKFYQRHAEVLANLVQAKYDDEQWSRVYKPLHDRLATQKRDALTAVAMEEYIEQLPERKSPDVLYEYLLIDVQTGSEVDTSRIVQGHASLQLYVQRCLMNLEKDVNSEHIPQEEWLWMKNYRVWEANRKVFLYPENYIEPELRDTKTPEFEDLIQELIQIDLSNVDLNQDSSVSKAFTNYLDKFTELSNLKIVGSYLSKDSDKDNNVKGDIILYLVGRSNNNPRIYYHREYIVNQNKWSPWKKINLTRV